MDVLEPDSILPAQYFEARKPMPEQRLVVAVLHDAIRCVETYRFAKDAGGRRQFREDFQWFFAEDAEWPFSFANICDVLGFDRHEVRHRLQLLCGPSPGPSAAPAPSLGM